MFEESDIIFCGRRFMLRIVSVMILLLLVFLPALSAQEAQQTQETDVIADQGHGVVIATTETAGDPESASTQTRVMSFNVGDMGGGGAFFLESADPMMMGGDPQSMINNPSVQKDLQLVDEQIEQIRAINKEFSAKIKESIHSENGELRIKDPQEMGQLIEDFRKSQQEQINQVLLPHQQDRLEQVSLQTRMKHQGTAETLSSQLAEKLGISPEQKQRLQKRSEELQKEIDDKVKQLRDDARKKLLDELTPDQRRKLEALIGDEFTPKAEDSDHRFPGMRFGRPNRKDF
jgi:hypothetical protein